MTTLVINKKATFDYEILETYEAGLELLGMEVKSIKTGHVSLKGSFISSIGQGKNKNQELFLKHAHIPLYKHAGDRPDYDPERPRRLLLKKKEINYLLGKKNEQGLTLIPLKMYTKRSFIKLEFAVAKGRKKHDKRELIKKREVDRTIRTLTKRGDARHR